MLNKWLRLHLLCLAGLCGSEQRAGGWSKGTSRVPGGHRVKRDTTENDNTYLGAETDQSTEEKVKEWPGRQNWTVHEGREFHGGCGQQRPGSWGTSQTQLGLSIVRRAAFYVSLSPRLTSSPSAPCPKAMAREGRTQSSASREINPKTAKVRVTTNQLTTANT